MPRRRQLAILTAIGALTLAACGGTTGTPDDPATSTTDASTPSITESVTSPSQTVTPSEATESPGASPDPQAVRTDDAAGTQVSLQAACDIDASDTPAGAVTIAYPDGWLVDEQCGYFDPEERSIDSMEPAGIDVVWHVDPVDFGDAAAPDASLDEHSRLTATVAGRQAVRIQGEATGQGMYPEGTAQTVWIVDLDPGTDDRGGILVGSTHDTDGIDYPQAIDVLDEMSTSVILADNPPAQSSVDAVLARSEGGGAPYAVVLADGCLQLRTGDLDGTVADEACDVTAGDQTMKLWTLSSDGVTVAAGFVSLDVHQILVARDDPDAVQNGTVPTSVEGAWAMALPIDEGDVIHAVDAQGDTLATAAPQ